MIPETISTTTEQKEDGNLSLSDGEEDMEPKPKRRRSVPFKKRWSASVQRYEESSSFAQQQEQPFAAAVAPSQQRRSAIMSRRRPAVDRLAVTAEESQLEHSISENNNNTVENPAITAPASGFQRMQRRNASMPDKAAVSTLLNDQNDNVVNNNGNKNDDGENDSPLSSSTAVPSMAGTSTSSAAAAAAALPPTQNEAYSMSNHPNQNPIQPAKQFQDVLSALRSRLPSASAIYDRRASSSVNGNVPGGTGNGTSNGSSAAAGEVTLGKRPSVGGSGGELLGNQMAMAAAEAAKFFENLDSSDDDGSSGPPPMRQPLPMEERPRKRPSILRQDSGLMGGRRSSGRVSFSVFPARAAGLSIPPTSAPSASSPSKSFVRSNGIPASQPHQQQQQQQPLRHTKMARRVASMPDHCAVSAFLDGETVNSETEIMETQRRESGSSLRKEIIARLVSATANRQQQLKKSPFSFRTPYAPQTQKSLKTSPQFSMPQHRMSLSAAQHVTSNNNNSSTNSNRNSVQDTVAAIVLQQRQKYQRANSFAAPSGRNSAALQMASSITGATAPSLSLGSGMPFRIPAQRSMSQASSMSIQNNENNNTSKSSTNGGTSFGNSDDSSHASFDGKSTGEEAIEPKTPNEKSASRAIHRAAEMNNPLIKNFLHNNAPRMARLLLDNPAVPSTGNVPIHVAASKGNLMALNHLLNADRNSAMIRNHAGNVALHHAVEHGHFAAVQLLCSRAPLSAGVQCEEGYLPLHESVSSASHHQDAPQITAVVLGAFPDAVKVTNDEGLLPIHLAAMSGYAAGLRTIFAYDFNAIYAQDNTELMYPLDFACDGLREEEDMKSDTEHDDEDDDDDDDVLSVARKRAPENSKHTDTKSQFNLCIDILLMSTLCNRPVLSPRDERENKFLPMHGAVAACPLPRTWKHLISMYGKDYGSLSNRRGRTALHLIGTLKNEVSDHVIVEMVKDLCALHREAACQEDNDGLLPLHTCLISSKSFAVIQAMQECNSAASAYEVPRDSKWKDWQGFFAFQIAAARNSSVSVIYSLLRTHPAGVMPGITSPYNNSN